MDTHLRNTVHSFSRTEGIEDVFDEQARKEVDARCETIREEYTNGETPIIEPQLEVPYTKKAMERAMKKLKEKYWKSTGLDGVLRSRPSCATTTTTTRSPSSSRSGTGKQPSFFFWYFWNIYNIITLCTSAFLDLNRAPYVSSNYIGPVSFHLLRPAVSHVPCVVYGLNRLTQYP